MKIGNLEISNKAVLAPMAGVTDLPFRMLCREQGSGLSYTEMVSAKAILYNNKNTDLLLESCQADRPLAIQMFGSDPEIMAEIAKRLEMLECDIIDINMGCPVPKIVNNGEGSALMREPLLVGRIVEAVSNAIEKPLTVKIRAGFNDQSKNAAEIAHIIEESGGAAVAVHGRTREEYYTGHADWSIIKEVKDRVKIPVIGNGDVVDYESAKRLMDETGCDAVMVGRACRGNPWIFKEISEGKPYKPSAEEIAQTVLRHARMLIEQKGEYIGVREMRKHFAWYTTGMKHASDLRNLVNKVERYEDFEKLCERLTEKK